LRFEKVVKRIYWQSKIYFKMSGEPSRAASLPASAWPNAGAWVQSIQLTATGSANYNVDNAGASGCNAPVSGVG